MTPHLVTGDDGKARCWWCGSEPLYRTYHDTEWGFPVSDEFRLFEKITLEGFQSGLSWLTILRKRENFRKAFLDFDFRRVARFNRRSVERLLKDAGIVRHRGKIESAIHNARRAVELAGEFGSLGAFFWRFERKGPCDGLPSATPASTEMSRQLKRRGWTYVGPTTAYAFMQAMGLANDHLPGCHVHAKVREARKAFRKP